MRIRPLNSDFVPFARVSEKQDKGGSPDRDPNADQQKQDKSEVEVEASDQEVNRAMESFSADQQARESGLSASLTGKGPGLKVILRDGSGTVIRQLTGEEFVKLRDTVTKDQKTPGKILDQKL